MKTTGKVIVITGGSSGIGKRLVEFFREGNSVISLSRSDSFPNIKCDLSDTSQILAAAEEIKSRFGKVDVLINNAGYGLYGATELLSCEEIERQLSVNLTGSILLTKSLLPLMPSGGKIVNVSSACALFPLPFRTMYCSSKAGLSMFSHALRMELAPYEIDVTAICPGDIKSNFTKNRVKNYATNERYGDRIALADRKISSREHKRMDEVKAVNKMIKIIERRRYKPMYIVGAKYKLFYFLYRILPHGLFMKVVGKLFS